MLLVEILLLLAIGAILMWAVPQLGYPEFVRVLIVIIILAAIVYDIVRGPFIL